MKKNYIVSTAALLTAIIVAASCKPKTPVKVYAGHGQVQLDTALKALTQPVNAQVIASIPVISPKKGTRTYTMELNGVMAYDTRNQTSIASRVAGRIERLLVKYNYQPVQKGQLIMEVYSPDLAAAQRELLFVAQQGDTEGLLSKAKQRLLLLGMQPAQIEQVLKTGQVIYRVPVYSNTSGYILEQAAAAASAPAAPAMAPAAAGDGMGGMGDQSATAAPALPAPASTPVLLREGQYLAAGQPVFTIYQPNSLVAEFSLNPQLASRLKRRQSLTFYPPSDKSNTTTAAIGLIEPVFRNGQNFTLARVYLNKSSFRPGQLLTASLPIEFEGGFWLPAAAVTRLGNKYILFRKTNNVFTPVEIITTAAIANMVQVKTDITGWQIAANAAYLVDSESFIKTSNSPQQ